MSKYGQPMSQTLAQMHLNELKMNDPKLNKMFDKLKKGDTVKIKHSSTLERGKDFIEYIVKSKNVVNKGRVEKITLASKDNPTAVKKFLYKRDGKVTFAVGDMAASIDDIREKYSLTNHEIIEDIEVEELDEAVKYQFVAIDRLGKVIGFASDERDAKDMARRGHTMDSPSKGKGVVGRNKAKVVKLKKPMSDKQGDMMINRDFDMNKFGGETTYSVGLKEEVEEAIDPADLDLDATDADKKAADKNIIMQMRKAMDVKGNMKIEFGDGKKEKVDAKILDMMTKAHMKIQKPRDKEKFVAMISKSKRDMLNVAKKLSTLKMDLDKDDEPTIKKVIDMLKKASGAHAGQAKDLEKAMTEEVDEKFQSRRPSSKEVKMAIGIANDPRYKQGNYSGAVKAIEKIRDGLSDYPEVAAALKKANENLDEGKMKDLLIKAQDLMGPSKNREQGIEFVMKGLKVSKKEATKLVDAVIKMSEETLDEKYDLYHKTFSDAMQHAYDYAKKKLGITVDSKEIDSKVATGPKKPSEGKTNKYRLKGKGGNLQIQVYNKGGSKPFELNMYKEENEMTKSLKDTVLELWTEASKSEEGFASDAQRKAAFASGYKEKGKKKDKDEGNAFGAALQAAKENGEDTFVVAGKKYDVKTEKLVGGQKKLDKDKDGDIDGKDFAMLRKSKKKEQKESIERYHETKKGSLRDAVLQMWGEKHTPDHKEDEKNEKKSLTKEKKDGSVKKMTDTGKEVTSVETSVKMPKIKETKNKV